MSACVPSSTYKTPTSRLDRFSVPKPRYYKTSDNKAAMGSKYQGNSYTEADGLSITYITERIIAMAFPSMGNDNSYDYHIEQVASMLETKHAKSCLVLNLSQLKSNIDKLSHQVMDFGWPEYLAPPLERVCAICKAMDNWLMSNPQHVVVLHCRGEQGRMGMIVASYMHYSNICASADQALDRFAMKRFYDEKMSVLTQPSQKRYVTYFAGFLSGSISINNNPLYLHHILIHGVPNFDSKGGCRPFIKIYEAMQPVFNSAVYNVSDNMQKVCISIQPGIPLRGDVLIKCFHKKFRSGGRDIIWRCQFHTCAISAYNLTFGKQELDDAFHDVRFPDNGHVELIFSSSDKSSSQISGFKSDVTVPVDEVGDVVERWDSYENFSELTNAMNGGLTRNGLSHPDSVNGRLLETSIEVEHILNDSHDGLYATINKPPHKEISPSLTHRDASKSNRLIANLNHMTLSSYDNELHEPTRVELPDMSPPHNVLETPTSYPNAVDSIDSGVSTNSGPGYIDNISKESGYHVNEISGNFKTMSPKEHLSPTQYRITSREQAQLDEILQELLGEVHKTDQSASTSYNYSTTENIGDSKSSTVRKEFVHTMPGWQEQKVYSTTKYIEETKTPDRKPYIPRGAFSYTPVDSNPKSEFPSSPKSYERTTKTTTYSTPEQVSPKQESPTWLEIQQQKLKAKKEGRTDEKIRQEKQLVEELKNVQTKYSAKSSSANAGQDYVSPSSLPVMVNGTFSPSQSYTTYKYSTTHNGPVVETSYNLSKSATDRRQVPQPDAFKGNTRSYDNQVFSETTYSTTLSSGELKERLPSAQKSPPTTPQRSSSREYMQQKSYSNDWQSHGRPLTRHQSETSFNRQFQTSSSSPILKSSSPPVFPPSSSNFPQHTVMQTHSSVYKTEIKPEHPSPMQKQVTEVFVHRSAPTKSQEPPRATVDHVDSVKSLDELEKLLKTSSSQKTANQYESTQISAKPLFNKEFVGQRAESRFETWKTVSRPSDWVEKTFSSNRNGSKQAVHESQHVRFKECDTNGHLTTSVYGQPACSYNTATNSFSFNNTSLVTASPLTTLYNTRFVDKAKHSNASTMSTTTRHCHMQPTVCKRNLFAISLDDITFGHLGSKLVFNEKKSISPSKSVHLLTSDINYPLSSSSYITPSCLGHDCSDAVTSNQNSFRGSHSVLSSSPSNVVYSKLHKVATESETDPLTANASSHRSTCSNKHTQTETYEQKGGTQVVQPTQPQPFPTPKVSTVVEEESIMLRPIGVQNLEPEGSVTGTLTSRTVSHGYLPVETPPFPVSPKTPYVNHGSVTEGTSHMSSHLASPQSDGQVFTEQFQSSEMSSHTAPRTVSPQYYTSQRSYESQETRQQLPLYQTNLDTHQHISVNEQTKSFPSVQDQQRNFNQQISDQQQHYQSGQQHQFYSTSQKQHFTQEHQQQQHHQNIGSQQQYITNQQFNGTLPSQKALHVDTSRTYHSGTLERSPRSLSSPPSPGMAGRFRTISHSGQYAGGAATLSPGSHLHSGQISPYFGQSRLGSMSSLIDTDVVNTTPKFVKDTSKHWYKPHISREQAIATLKDKTPGTFVVRDSNSFPGSFGLAVKVDQVPATVQNRSSTDPQSDLVRHFLIVPTPKGVHLKGCPNEPVFGSLAALVYQHSMTPLALPCKLLLPQPDMSMVDGPHESPTQELPQSGENILEMGAACHVLYINSVDVESLTGPVAIAKALKATFDAESTIKTTVVHFKVSTEGITLTDVQRKLFFRRNYKVPSVTYCGLDREDKRWKHAGEDQTVTYLRIFGFVARKPGGASDNTCHLFAELDLHQPASSIVHFVSKFMMQHVKK